MIEYFRDKWLIFNLIETKKKTYVYSITSKCDGSVLGFVKWYPCWRNYCFFPNILIETIHSDRCLLTISEFITKLNAEHKKVKVVRRGDGK